MRNIPTELRRILEEELKVVNLVQLAQHTSADKTTKYLFQTEDGHTIESVYIPTQKRATVCISTQIGCAYGCIFCASGMGGLIRNLRADEIVSQVLLVKKDNSCKPLTNIVLMGMGEPFANYDNTLKAVRILNNPHCLGLAARRITISTCGLPKEIMRFAKEKLQVELSISLHAADNDLRGRLMPGCKKYPLSEVIKTAGKYTRMTHRVITFEYVMLGGVNDRREDAKKLAALLRGINCKVNLIPYNPVPEFGFLPVKRNQLEGFKKILEEKKVHFTVRRSRGSDIKGACGQLRASLDKGN